MDKKHIKIMLFLFVAVLLYLSLHSDSVRRNFLNVNDEQFLTGNQIIETRVSIIQSPPSNCSFQLNKGWNLVSFYCIGSNSERSDVLKNISNDYDSIFSYVPTDTADPWKSYNPNLPNWTIQQLNQLDRNKGYWILMNKDANYFYEGRKRDSTIQLYTGWNLVGYPSLNTTLINDSLQGLNYTIVKTYDASSGVYLIYVFNNPENTLTVFETYRGYWINSSNNQTWSVN